MCVWPHSGTSLFFNKGVSCAVSAVSCQTAKSDPRHERRGSTSVTCHDHFSTSLWQPCRTMMCNSFFYISRLSFPPFIFIYVNLARLQDCRDFSAHIWHIHRAKLQSKVFSSQSRHSVINSCDGSSKAKHLNHRRGQRINRGGNCKPSCP